MSMANMSYCRFQNTAPDLSDCLDYLWEEVGSKEEWEARKRIVNYCREVARTVDDRDEIMGEYIVGE